MIDVSLETHPLLYKDYEACLSFLKKIDIKDYKYPENKTIFHVYTEIKNPKELMVIKSFLATQNLQHCEMIVWSDYNINDNPLIQPYKDHVTFKVWDAIEEARGTVLENKYDILNAKDHKYYLQSDLLRLIALHKYGGVWADMDIIFLRDFKPLLDQEYMYMWGSETDYATEGACATVLSLQKESKLSEELLKEVLITPARPATTCWGKDMFATLYRRHPFTVLPSTFFNTEWCVNVKHKGKSLHIQKGWFEDAGYDEDFIFDGVFTWHWHNSSNKHKEVKQGSKFEKFQTSIDAKLKQKGILK
tara:strand:- start:58636 stop:59547 length:912 start_codon:yes stop_codon:yes gene_type:complete